MHRAHYVANNLTSRRLEDYRVHLDGYYHTINHKLILRAHHSHLALRLLYTCVFVAIQLFAFISILSFFATRKFASIIVPQDISREKTTKLGCFLSFFTSTHDGGTRVKWKTSSSSDAIRIHLNLQRIVQSKRK